MNYWSGKSVLVTGGLGFIGSHLVDELLKRGVEKVIIVDDLSKGSIEHLKKWQGKNVMFKRIDLTKELIVNEARESDIIFHLAAKIGGIKYFHKYPATILRDNLLMAINVFESARLANVDRVVCISSSMVFEKSQIFPLSEDLIEVIPPPMSSYGFSKLAGEYIARAYSEEYGVKYVIVRPFNVYGPGEMPGDEPGIAHVIPDLVKKVVEGQYPLEIFGDGRQTRSFTYITDAIEGILLVAEKAVNDDYNLGSDEETRIIDLAKTIWELCGKKEEFRVKFLPSLKYDVRRRVPDITKVKKLGWKPKVKLKEGLKLYIEWNLRDKTY